MLAVLSPLIGSCAPPVAAPPVAAPSHAPGLAPAEPGAQQTHRIDLSLYFPDGDAELADRGSVIVAVDAFAATHLSARDPAALDAYLDRAAVLLSGLARHEQYLELKVSLDSSDRAAVAARDDVSAQSDRVHASVEATVSRLSPGEFEEDAGALPALRSYDFLVARIRRAAAHALPPDQELVLDKVADPALSQLWQLYEETLRSTPFPKIATRSGERDAHRDHALLMTDPDPAVRERADREWFLGYVAREPVYAAILLDIVETRNRVARLRHFDDAPAEKYFASFMTTADVTATIASMSRYAELNRRYQRLRAAHVGAAESLSEAHSWDLSAPAHGFQPPRFSIARVREVAREALRPLGPEYVAQLDALLDPGSGRADIGFGGRNRDAGGFSMGFAGAPSVLFVGDYQGLLKNAAEVVHEGGHAVHRAFMNERKVSPFYMVGPHFLSEAFAILNELLFEEYLARTSDDPRARAYYLEALVEKMTFEIFTSAEEGALEQSIYEGVAAGRIRTGADLDALTLSVLPAYEIWPAREAERQHIWMAKTLMFEDPLYLVNYLYAGLLAIRLYAMVSENADDFARRYHALLSDGYCAPPSELLQKFFGRPTAVTDLIPADMKLMNTKIDALAAVYQHLDAGANAASSRR